jgi:cytochrome c5
MRSSHLSLFVAAVISGSILLSGVTQNRSLLAQTVKDQTVKKPGAAKTGQAQQTQDEGEQVFQQQCARCHNAPEGFSPRISGTIARHMRVRASLSKHDEEQLLHFLNP